jgi:TRAP-type C4-dicarboxylate transport system substrate-binding protein
LGATPVALPFGELFSALQRGSVDGQEGSIDSFYRFKLYQTQSYLSLTRHSYAALVLVINLNRFKDLSGSEQKIILDAAQEATHYGRSLSRDLEYQNINKLRDRGLAIESNPDWEGFRKKIFYEVQDKYVREDGRKLLREIDRLLR